MPGLHLTDTGLEAAWPAPKADLVEFCLFDENGRETDRLALSRQADGVHLIREAGIGLGQRYGLRAHGPWIPEQGVWHDPRLLLVDPYARALAGDYRDHPSLHHDGPRADTAGRVPLGIVTEPPPKPRPGPTVPWEETVVYEAHVRGLTKLHPEVPPKLRGTYLGACSPPVIEHLHRLGVTTVEFMPLAHHVTEPFLQAQGRTNYWGYSTLCWFAPHGDYATADGRQLHEFARMVDTFHDAGLEVVVDMVFNHTAEGGLEGPILSMKGLDNRAWYRLDDSGDYVDWTGTGNTIDTSNPRVRRDILAALRWWSQTLGVDGFRFDLAVTLGRGRIEFEPGQLAWLTRAPVVGRLKLIAEPWDLGPRGYRLGEFGSRWVEWNGRYRDEVRDIWRGRGDGAVLSRRLSGSPDVFEQRPATASLNFVTAHDGFTLADLVSYDHKHNRANGEENTDGHDDNRSWNSGTEGPTDDPVIVERRRRRSAALLATLMLSAGIPMILAGDELGRSQAGNNNAYSLDDPTTWLTWERHPLTEQLETLAEVRKRYLSTLQRGKVRRLDHPWAFELAGEATLVVVVNPSDEPGDVQLPEGQWALQFDSSGTAPLAVKGMASVPAWTLLMLVAS